MEGRLMSIRAPAARPCGSCPYRCDTPSGVWERHEYEKLPRFDGETWEQEPSVFMCHQADGRLCAGWVGVHDMAESLGLRMATAMGTVTPEVAQACLDYTTDVPLYASGAEAAEAGMREVEHPSDDAIEAIEKLRSKRARR